jgi:hypothetical protein
MILRAGLEAVEKRKTLPPLGIHSVRPTELRLTVRKATGDRANMAAIGEWIQHRVHLGQWFRTALSRPVLGAHGSPME